MSMRTVVPFLVVVAVIALCALALPACHILLHEAACNTSADCPSSLPICDDATGFCAATASEGEGEGVAGEGEGAEGEGEGVDAGEGEGEGAEGEGEGEGAVGEGEGEGAVGEGEGEGAVGEGEGEGAVGEGEGEGISVGEGEGEGAVGEGEGEGAAGEGEGEGGTLPTCATVLDGNCDPTCFVGGRNIDPDCACPGQCNNSLVVGNFFFNSDQSSNNTINGCVQGNITVFQGGTLPPNLRGVIGDLTVQSSTLSTLNMGGAGCIGGTLKISNNANLTSFSSNVTTTIGADLDVESNPALATFAPPVQNIGGAITYIHDDALAHVSFPFNFNSAAVTISSNAHLATIDVMPNGVTGNVVIKANPLLTSLQNRTPTTAVAIGGTLTISDNANIANGTVQQDVSAWTESGAFTPTNNGECLTPQSITPGASIPDSNAGFPQGLVGTCGGANSEKVYELFAPGNGILTATLTPNVSSNMDVVLYATTACGNILAEIACSNSAGVGGAETISASVVTGPIFVVADTDGGVAGGAYTLSVTLE
jgi:hypothetical protein